MNMGALSVLFIVLPVLAVSLCHTLEVILTAGRWEGRHSAVPSQVRPGLLNILFRLSGMNLKAFFIASGAGFLMLLLATAALFVGGLWTESVWATVFMAYSAYVLINVVRAVTLKCYVPGLVTSVLSIPLIAYTAYSLSLVWSWWEMLLFVIVGLALAVVGLCLAQRLGHQRI